MRLAPLAVLGCAAALAACGSEEESTPAACLEGSGGYASALGDAPGEVTLVDGIRISECLVQDQPGGELGRIGTTMVGVAEQLGDEARAGDAQAALRLGYLVGAVERGAEETGGVHAELVRRLESVAETGRLPPRAEAAYRRGLEAGREDG